MVRTTGPCAPPGRRGARGTDARIQRKGKATTDIGARDAHMPPGSDRMFRMLNAPPRLANRRQPSCITSCGIFVLTCETNIRPAKGLKLKCKNTLTRTNKSERSESLSLTAKVERLRFSFTVYSPTPHAGNRPLLRSNTPRPETPKAAKRRAVPCVVAYCYMARGLHSRSPYGFTTQASPTAPAANGLKQRVRLPSESCVVACAGASTLRPGGHGCRYRPRQTARRTNSPASSSPARRSSATR